MVTQFVTIADTLTIPDLDTPIYARVSFAPQTRQQRLVLDEGVTFGPITVDTNQATGAFSVQVPIVANVLWSITVAPLGDNGQPPPNGRKWSQGIYEITADTTTLSDFVDTDVLSVTATLKDQLLAAATAIADVVASNDGIVTALVEDEGSDTYGALATRLAPKLDGTAQSTEPDPSVGTWVDTGSVVEVPPHVQHEEVTVNLGALDWITLGTTPVEDSLIVWKNGTKLALSAYTLTGSELAITGATAADVISLYYLYPGDDSAPAAATTPQILARDSFTRADSAVSLGTADVGGAWTVDDGVWGISSNQAYLATPSADFNDAAWFDVNTADVIVQCKLATVDVNGGPGLMTRLTDDDNGYVTNNVGIYKREAAVNSATPLGGAFSATFVSGDTIRIRWQANVAKVYRQAASTGAFALVATTPAQTFQSTADKHGIRSRSVNTGRIDDFLIASAT